MGNFLTTDKRRKVLELLSESNSVSGAARLTGVHRDTITGIMVRFGDACYRFLEWELRDLDLTELQLDEMWTFVKKKKKQWTGNEPDADVIGEHYLFIALDKASRLIPSHFVGRRDTLSTFVFVQDLFERLKLPRPHASDDHGYKAGKYKTIKISTDGFEPYVFAIAEVFGPYAEHAQLVKKVNKDGVDITKRRVSGNMDLTTVSTSLVERSNLTTRTFMKRFTRRTLGFSKSLDNLRCQTAINFTLYNYVRPIKTLKTTPAVAAGLVDRKWSFLDLYEELQHSFPEYFNNNPGKAA